MCNRDRTRGEDWKGGIGAFSIITDTYCCSPLLGTGRSYVSSIFGAIVIPVASLARCRKKRSFTQLESLPGFFFIRIPCTGISKQTLLNEFWTLCGWFMGGSRMGELGTGAEQKEVSKKMARLGLCVCGGSKGERLSWFTTTITGFTTQLLRTQWNPLLPLRKKALACLFDPKPLLSWIKYCGHQKTKHVITRTPSCHFWTATKSHFQFSVLFFS